MGNKKICLLAMLFSGILTMQGAFGQACVSDPLLSVEDLEVTCEDLFGNAQLAIQTVFQNITASDVGCDVDLTDRIRVEKINWVKPNGNYFVPLDIEKLMKKLVKREVFAADEYDYTVVKTQKLFHYCLLFRPGVYEVFWHILGDDGQPIDAFRAKRKQIIIIDKKCDGCFGALSCNGCTGCREKYIPDFVQQQNLKSMLGDWLLIGLSVMTLLGWSSIRR